MGLGDHGVDQVRLSCQALEEHIAAGCVAIAFRVYVREIRLRLDSAIHVCSCSEAVDYLNDRQKFLDFSCFDCPNLQLNLLSVVLRGSGLKLEVKRQHCGCLRSCRSRLLVGCLCLGPEGIEFADHDR